MHCFHYQRIFNLCNTRLNVTFILPCLENRFKIIVITLFTIRFVNPAHFVINVLSKKLELAWCPSSLSLTSQGHSFRRAQRRGSHLRTWHTQAIELKVPAFAHTYTNISLKSLTFFPFVHNTCISFSHFLLTLINISLPKFCFPYFVQISFISSFYDSMIRWGATVLIPSSLSDNI